MLFLSSAMKSRKRLDRDVVDAFAAHSGFVCDVTETDCWAQSTGHVTFSRLSNRMKNCCLCLSLSLSVSVYVSVSVCLSVCLSVSRVLDASSLCVPFNGTCLLKTFFSREENEGMNEWKCMAHKNFFFFFNCVFTAPEEMGIKTDNEGFYVQMLASFYTIF